MLEPQSTGLFVLLIVVFGGLTWWMVVTRQPVFRLLAACLAFVPAMLFGVVAVNKYYGYYQTWGAALADLTGQGAATGNTAPPPGIVTAGSTAGGGPAAGGQLSTLTGSSTYLRLAQQQGYTVHLMVAGPRSHITRSVYVYLPPEYFQPGYQDYRFPVMELIHGQPGRAAGLDQRGGRHGHPGPADQPAARQAGGAGDAGRERRAAGLAAVPQPGRRPAGPDLPGPGPAAGHRAPVPGRAARPGLGGGRATPRAGSAPPTWRCASRPGTASPAC